MFKNVSGLKGYVPDYVPYHDFAVHLVNLRNKDLPDHQGHQDNQLPLRHLVCPQVLVEDLAFLLQLKQNKRRINLKKFRSQGHFPLLRRGSQFHQKKGRKGQI